MKKKLINNKKTIKFYDDLMTDKKVKTFFKKDERFEVKNNLLKKNIINYFDLKIKKYISRNDEILDFGCGSGLFSIKLSKLTKKNITAVDISPQFILAARKNFKKFGRNKAKFNIVPLSGLSKNTKKYDKILLVDVIHHLENIEKTIKNLKKFLKKNGNLIVFEPNLLNPLILITHFMDKNENGLLRLGLRSRYEKIFQNCNMKIKHFEYNGIIIGPESKLLNILGMILNLPFLNYFLSWLNPKVLFIVEAN